MSTIKLETPVEDGDKRWLAIYLGMNYRGQVSISSATFNFRRKNGEWSIATRTTYHPELPEEILREVYTKHINNIGLRIDELIDERTKWLQRLAELSPQPEAQ